MELGVPLAGAHDRGKADQAAPSFSALGGGPRRYRGKADQAALTDSAPDGPMQTA
jgi:hypothetical protein